MAIPSESFFRVKGGFRVLCRRYRILEWFLFSLSLYLFWAMIPYAIDTSSSVEIRLSVSDLDREAASLVTDFDDPYWLERVSDIVKNCEEVCAARKYDVITQKSIRWGGEAMTESFLYFCKSGLALLNARLDPLKDVGPAIVCVEEYAGLTRKVKRFSKSQLSGVDVQRIDAGRQIYDSHDPMDSCLYHHAVDIIESKWHI